MIVTLILSGAGVPEVRAQEDHDHDPSPAQHTHDGLHFSHPLIAESITPDTKLRINHQFMDVSNGDQLNVGNFEAEYAFLRSIGIPLTNQEQFTTRWTTSVFWHF